MDKSLKSVQICLVQEDQTLLMILISRQIWKLEEESTAWVLKEGELCRSTPINIRNRRTGLKVELYLVAHHVMHIKIKSSNKNLKLTMRSVMHDIVDFLFLVCDTGSTKYNSCVRALPKNEGSLMYSHKLLYISSVFCHRFLL